MYKLLTVLLLTLPVSSFAQTPEEKGLAIAKEADKRDLGWQDSSANMQMILSNKLGESSTRDIRIKSMETGGEDNGDKRQKDRQPEAFTDHIGHGQLVFERIAEITLDKIGHPNEVAFPHRIIETIFGPEIFHAGQIDRFSGSEKFADIRFHIVPWGELDDRENDDTGQDQCRDHRRRSKEYVAKHLRMLLGKPVRIGH